MPVRRTREARVGQQGAAAPTVAEHEQTVDEIQVVPVATTRSSPAPPWRRRFRLRQGLALLLGAALFAAPMVTATIVVLGAARVFEPPGGSALVAWWVAVAGVSWAVAYGVDRALRRHLPLVGLYRLALVLPADVPSRLGVALRAGSVRDLERDVIDLRDAPAEDRTTAAARVVALASALHKHDRFTRGHSERVRAYTDLLATELDVEPTDRELLRWGALLHDIGKLEVSTSLLNKPAALDDDEWLQMRSHPAHGARLAAPLRGWLGEWVDAVGQHHERFDGTGYPDGVGGRDISLAGRIVAVADAYETMTARRPYKRPMSHEAARQELVAQAGAHFDPQVVRAMLNLSVRRLRWAAGPLSVLGDVVAARLITAVGSAGHVVDTVVRVVPATGAAAAMATAGVVAVGPTSPPPPGAPVVHVADSRAEDGFRSTSRSGGSASTGNARVAGGGWSSVRARDLVAPVEPTAAEGAPPADPPGLGRARGGQEPAARRARTPRPAAAPASRALAPFAPGPRATPALLPTPAFPNPPTRPRPPVVETAPSAEPAARDAAPAAPPAEDRGR